MALTGAQKKWAIGGGIGALALALGYGLLNSSKPSSHHGMQAPQARAPHHKRRKHDHDDHQRGEHRQRHHKHGGYKHG